MAKFVLNVLLSLFFWGFFVWVIFNIEPPKSLTQANVLQLAYFYIPLFLAVTFTLNLLIKTILASSSLSLGIIFLLTLKAMGLFSFLYIGLTIIATLLLFSYFKKDLPSLTSILNVRKLTGWRPRHRSSRT